MIQIASARQLISFYHLRRLDSPESSLHCQPGPCPCLFAHCLSQRFLFFIGHHIRFTGYSFTNRYLMPFESPVHHMADCPMINRTVVLIVDGQFSTGSQNNFSPFIVFLLIQFPNLQSHKVIRHPVSNRGKRPAHGIIFYNSKLLAAALYPVINGKPFKTAHLHNCQLVRHSSFLYPHFQRLSRGNDKFR